MTTTETDNELDAIFSEVPDSDLTDEDMTADPEIAHLWDDDYDVELKMTDDGWVAVRV